MAWGRVDERLVDVTGQDGLLCTGNLVGGNADEVRSLKCNLSALAAPTGSASFAKAIASARFGNGANEFGAVMETASGCEWLPCQQECSQTNTSQSMKTAI